MQTVYREIAVPDKGSSAFLPLVQHAMETGDEREDTRGILLNRLEVTGTTIRRRYRLVILLARLSPGIGRIALKFVDKFGDRIFGWLK